MNINFRGLLLLIQYWFPVFMGWSIAMVLQRATGWPILPSGIKLYLLLILAAYSLDRLVDFHYQEIRPGWLKPVLLVALIISSLVGMKYVIDLAPGTIALIFIFSLVIIFYRNIKKIPLLKSVLVGIVWIWSGVAFSFQNDNWFAWQFWTLGVSLPLVILVTVDVILCDFKDLLQDEQNGVQSLPVLVGARSSTIIVSILLVVSALVSYFQGQIGLVISSILLLGLAQSQFVLSSELMGPLLIDAALVIPGLLISLHLI